jgi:hypothetical protein
MAQTFRELADEFNKSATASLTDKEDFQVTVAKYTLLMRHKAQSPEDKKELTGIMFKTAISNLEQAVTDLPDMKTFDSIQLNSISGMLRQLVEPENIRYLPQNAATKTADTTLDLLRTLENYHRSSNVANDSYKVIKSNYTELAYFALDVARVMKLAEAAGPEMKTVNDIQVARPLNLKGKQP